METSPSLCQPRKYSSQRSRGVVVSGGSSMARLAAGHLSHCQEQETSLPRGHRQYKIKARQKETWLFYRQAFYQILQAMLWVSWKHFQGEGPPQRSLGDEQMYARYWEWQQEKLGCVKLLCGETGAICMLHYKKFYSINYFYQNGQFSFHCTWSHQLQFNGIFPYLHALKWQTHISCSNCQ